MRPAIHSRFSANAVPRVTAQSGFTLLELLLVIALVGILAAISMGRYSHYVEQSNRRAAVTQLYAAQQSMERNRLRTGRYSNLPALTQDGYQFAFVATEGGAGYILTATPERGDAATECGTLSINQRDMRTVSKGVLAQCWQ